MKSPRFLSSHRDKQRVIFCHKSLYYLRTFIIWDFFPVIYLTELQARLSISTVPTNLSLFLASLPRNGSCHPPTYTSHPSDSLDSLLLFTYPATYLCYKWCLLVIHPLILISVLSVLFRTSACSTDSFLCFASVIFFLTWDHSLLTMLW